MGAFASASKKTSRPEFKNSCFLAILPASAAMALSVIVAPKQLVAVSALALLLAVFLFRMPEIALAMFLIIGILKANPALDSLIGGFDLTIYLAFIVWSAIAYALYRKKPVTLSAALIIPALSFICLILFALIYSENPAYGLNKAGRFIILTALGLIAPPFILADERSFGRFAKTLALVGLFIGINVIRAWLIKPDELVRTLGTQHITLGRTAGYGAIAAAYLAIAADRKAWKIPAIVTAAIAVTAIFLSGGRGPTLALVASPAAAAVIASLSQGLRRSIKLFVPAVLVPIVFSLLYWSNHLPRVLQMRVGEAFAPILTGGSTDTSSAFRLTLFSYALSIFRQTPVFGAGFGAFPAAAGFPLFLSSNSYPHNIFLEILAELGLVGLTIFVVLILFAVNKLVAGLKSGTGTKQWIATIAGLILIMFSILNASVSGDVNDNKVLWFAIGLAYAVTLPRWSNSGQREHPKDFPSKSPWR